MLIVGRLVRRPKGASEMCNSPHLCRTHARMHDLRWGLVTSCHCARSITRMLDATACSGTLVGPVMHDTNRNHNPGSKSLWRENCISHPPECNIIESTSPFHCLQQVQIVSRLGHTPLCTVQSTRLYLCSFLIVLVSICSGF